MVHNLEVHYDDFLQFGSHFWIIQHLQLLMEVEKI